MLACGSARGALRTRPAGAGGMSPGGRWCVVSTDIAPTAWMRTYASQVPGSTGVDNDPAQNPVAGRLLGSCPADGVLLAKARKTFWSEPWGGTRASGMEHEDAMPAVVPGRFGLTPAASNPDMGPAAR